MRLKTPRIAPLSDAELSAEQVKVLAPFNQPPINIFRTLVRNPVALSAFRPWFAFIMRSTDMTPRDREVIILRVGFRCRSGYEWAQHVVIGQRVGMTLEEIERIKQGPDAGWSPREAALIRAVDELQSDQFVTDVTWAELKEHFTDTQCLDVVFVACQYIQIASILNTLGVQIEEPGRLDPELATY